MDMGQIRDIMEKNIITIEKDQTVLQAAQLMKENDISFVVIVENGNPIGVLSERDFVQKFCVDNKNQMKKILQK